MDTLLSLIENEKWQEALDCFMEHLDNNELSEELCVFGATILEHFEDTENRFDIIVTGLKINPNNYELYLLLGNYYASTDNPYKALICYENALFYSRKQNQADDALVIEELYQNYTDSTGITLRKTTILILDDGNQSGIELLKESIHSTCPEGSYTITEVKVDKNRISAINDAVRKADPDTDLLLLSCDVVLTSNALFTLKLGLYDKETVASASAVSNNASFNQIPLGDSTNTISDAALYALKNNVPEAFPYESKCAIDMSFVLIKADAVGKLFPMDEAFASEEFTGINLGLSAIEHGYENYVCWNSYVFRQIRLDVHKRNLLLQNSEALLLKKKWGFSPEYYMNTRTDLIKMINRDQEDPLDILEVGAGLGSTLARVKHDFPNSTVRGIEIVQPVAEFASKYSDMRCTNIETYEFPETEMYDYIMFGDVLEHLIDPFSLVDRLKKNLKPGGCILASIPNIMNANVIYELLHGNFAYQDSGILDRTHLRFFTKNEVVKLFSTRGYSIERLAGTAHPLESTEVHKDFFEKLLTIDGIADKNEFETIQYLVCAKKI